MPELLTLNGSPARFAKKFLELFDNLKRQGQEKAVYTPLLMNAFTEFGQVVDDLIERRITKLEFNHRLKEVNRASNCALTEQVIFIESEKEFGLCLGLLRSKEVQRKLAFSKKNYDMIASFQPSNREEPRVVPFYNFIVTATGTYFPSVTACFDIRKGDFRAVSEVWEEETIRDYYVYLRKYAAIWSKGIAKILGKNPEGLPD